MTEFGRHSRTAMSLTLKVATRESDSLFIGSISRCIQLISQFRFYIRSKSDPRVFWSVFQQSGFDYRICASQSRRTRFQILNKASDQDGNVMIGSDSVIIYPAESRYASVSIGTGGVLQLEGHSDFKLSDLKCDFVSFSDDDNTVRYRERKGEEWELVS